MKCTSSLEHSTQSMEKQRTRSLGQLLLLWEGDSNLWGQTGSEALDSLPPWLWRQRLGALEESGKADWEDFCSRGT